MKTKRHQQAPTIALRFTPNEVTVLSAYSKVTGLTRTRIIKQFVQDQMSMMGSVIINEANAKKEDENDPGEWTNTLPGLETLKKDQNSAAAPARE
jgi:hypothetical protein